MKSHDGDEYKLILKKKEPDIIRLFFFCTEQIQKQNEAKRYFASVSVLVRTVIRTSTLH